MELIPWVAQSVNLWKWQMYRNCDFPPCQDGSFFKWRYVYCTYVSLFKLSFIFNIYLTNRGIYQSISDDKKTTTFLKHSHFFFFFFSLFFSWSSFAPRWKLKRSTMIFAGEKNPLWSCDTMNTQVILRIKHKDTLTMKVLFPSQVISMYKAKTFVCYLWPIVEHLLKKQNVPWH